MLPTPQQNAAEERRQRLAWRIIQFSVIASFVWLGIRYDAKRKAQQ